MSLKLMVLVHAVTVTLLLGSTGLVIGSDCFKTNAIDPVVATRAFKTAAQNGFDELMEKAAHAKDTYGFKTDDVLNDAVMGEPMAVYTVSKQNVLAYSAGQDLEPILELSGRWLIPINIHGSFRAFVEISQTPTNTFVTKTGSPSAARVWKTIVKRWPAEKNFHPKLVVYRDIPGYFFTIPEIDPQNMTDIVQIVCEIDKPATLSPAAVIISSWRS